jgi:hypothetical protein
MCAKLHEPLRECNDQESNYSLDIDEFVANNKEELKLDNPDTEDMDDASYYTKSKMMFNISDFYIGKP